MEGRAVGGRVIKALQASVLEVSEVGVSAIQRHLMTVCQHVVKDVIDAIDIIEAAGRDSFPACLSAWAVGLFQVARHLRQRALCTVKGDGHGAVDFAVLLVKLGDFGLNRNVHFAEHLNRATQAAEEHAVALLVELLSEGALSDLAIEGEADLLEFRFNVLNKIQVALAREFVVGVTRHLDVEIGGRFFGGGIQFTAVQEQTLKRGAIMDGAAHQLRVQRFKRRPLAAINDGGNKRGCRGVAGVGGAGGHV